MSDTVYRQYQNLIKEFNIAGRALQVHTPLI